MIKYLLKVYRTIRRRVLSAPQPDKWVFIVGCYNSGTTLLHKLLAEFPETGSMPSEGQFYTSELLLPSENGYKRLWALGKELFVMNDTDTYKANPEQLKKDWAVYYDNRKAPVLLEKSPTNAGRMLWLQKHFPNAHFICIIRNGYAVAEGINRKTGHSFEKTAQQWSESNQIMLDDLSKVKKWHKVFYEDLVVDPKKELTEICNFIGIDSAPVKDIVGKKMKIHEQSTTIENKNQRSFSSLTDEDISIINRYAVDMLKRLGYDVNTPS